MESVGSRMASFVGSAELVHYHIISALRIISYAYMSEIQHFALTTWLILLGSFSFCDFFHDCTQRNFSICVQFDQVGFL